MTHKRHSKRKVGPPRVKRKLTVWAEHRDSVDVDRFVAVLVTLALRRVEEEANQREADGG